MHDRTGLTNAETDRAAWIVTDGVRVGGLRAVGLVLAIVWNTRVPLLAWRVPGVPWVLDRLYEWISRNRYRFPGRTPWCVEHPDDCGSPPE